MFDRTLLIVGIFLSSISTSYAGFVNYTGAKGATAPLFNTAISGIRQITVLVFLILAIPIVATIIKIIIRERRK